jgi:hypothetical protein
MRAHARSSPPAKTLASRESGGLPPHPSNEQDSAEEKSGRQSAATQGAPRALKPQTALIERGHVIQELNLLDARPATKKEAILKTTPGDIADGDDYKRNRRMLTIIQWCVFTLSSVATGATNAIAHYKTIGVYGAVPLAAVLMGFVEAFYFTLRHGLATSYKGSQRFAANACYRIIQITMALNMSLLCVWIVGQEPPQFLLLWNHWSIAVHGALAMIGVAWVSDTDWVVADHIRRLKAATTEDDIQEIRKSVRDGSALVIGAAKIRGHLDALKEAFNVLFRGKEQPES